MWTTKKLAGKKHNIDPMWKVLMKVDLGEPTSFLDHVYLGVTQRERETSKDIVDNYRNIFESRISAGVKEKLLSSGRPDADISSLSYDVEGHAKKCVERYCELADKTTQQIYKSLSTPCLDDHLFEEEELGELSKVCSQIVLKCLYLSRIGRPDIPWSVNKLTQAVTIGPELVTDAWLVWSLIYTTRVDPSNIVMWVILLNNADWDCFKTLTSREILKIRNQLLEEHCAFLAVTRLFQEVGCVRNKLQSHTVRLNLQ